MHSMGFHNLIDEEDDDALDEDEEDDDDEEEEEVEEDYDMEDDHQEPLSGIAIASSPLIPSCSKRFKLEAVGGSIAAAAGDLLEARSGILKTFKPLSSPQCSMDDDSSTESEEEVTLAATGTIATTSASGQRSVNRFGRGGLAGVGALAGRRAIPKQDGGIASSTSRAVSTPSSFTSSEQQPSDYQHAQVISKRKARTKELCSKYYADCLSCCRELLMLQHQWRQELQAPVPGLINLGFSIGAEIEVTQDVLSQKADIQIDMTHSVLPKIKPNISITPESSNTDSAVDVLNCLEGPMKGPLRRHLAWRTNEREALRRGLLMFGLGRSEKVRGIMRGLLKQMRHGLGDVADCCWEFVHACGVFADEKENAYAEKLYAKATDLGIEMGPEVSDRVGQWERMEKSASVWLKRIRLLDNLGIVVRLCANPETQDASHNAIESLGDATMPCGWWNRECDLALLDGVYKHGFGNYEALRTDEHFADIFRCLNARALPNSRLKGNLTGESEHRSSQHGLTIQPNIRVEGNEATWPDSNILTRRLKRLVEHIGRIGQQVLRPEKGIGRKTKQSRIWSKREKLNFLRILLAWGLPVAPGHGGKVCWQFFRDHASVRPLRNKKESSLEACYQGLIKEMKQIFEGSRMVHEKASRKKTSSCTDEEESTDESVDKEMTLTDVVSQEGPAVLTHKSAVRLRDRLELFATVRQALDFFLEDWRHLGLSMHQSHNLPSWWQAGHHDRELVLGVLTHGFGNWDAIFKDSSFSFKTEADQEKIRRGLAKHGLQNFDPGWQAQASDDSEEIVKMKGKRDASQSARSLLWPSPKSCVKRLKFVGNVLKQQLHKHRGMQL